MRTETAEVSLSGWTVGDLHRASSGRIGFKPRESWARAAGSPILGQKFLDSPLQTVVGGRTGDLPAFFANLLPQGVNRQFVEEVQGTCDDLDLLVALGQDLPGAVAVRAGGQAFPLEEPADEGECGDWSLRLTASLTGMQPKFSMSRTPHGFTLPARGEHGDWIVKLPGQLLRTPEIEYSTMEWARVAGLSVPETLLVPLEQVRGVPRSNRTASHMAYACRRFDRPNLGVRIHQEDFAQVLGLHPREVTEAVRGRLRNHAVQGRLLRAICPEDLPEWLHWLVFNILCGNSDAHQKNLALWYPHPRQARLAPAFDLLAQVVYPEFTPAMELSVAGVRDFYRIGVEHLLALGRSVGAEVSERLVRQMVDRALQAWRDVRVGLPLEPEERGAIDAHLARLPLARLRSPV